MKCCEEDALESLRCRSLLSGRGSRGLGRLGAEGSTWHVGLAESPPRRGPPPPLGILAAMRPFAAGALVFVTSASVLVLEILAARLLAPYVGVTLETYTAIIGTILAAIALGTWVGGRLADRRDPRGLLGPILILGGALSLSIVPIVRLIGSLPLGGGPAAVVLLVLAGFFAPAAVLSAVPPTVIKLQLSDLAETGSTVGRLSALGTAGAIFGTFATGFVLVATLPTTPIVVGVAIALMVLGGRHLAVPPGVRGVTGPAVPLRWSWRSSFPSGCSACSSNGP